MALPSQGGRVGARAGGGGGRRRKGGPGLIPVALLLVAAAGVAGYFLWPDGSPEDALATNTPEQSEPERSDPTPRDDIRRNEIGRQPNQQPDRPADRPVDRQTDRQPETQQASTQPTITIPPVATRPVETPRTTTPAQNPASSQPANQPANQPTSTRSSSSVRDALSRAETAVRSNDLLRARRLLSDVILSNGASETDRDRAREDAAMINEQLVFSPLVVPGDTIAMEYRIESGDTLSRIAANQGLAVDWRFIQRINNITNPSRIRLGQRLKLVRGPFHAIVHKDDFRLDIFQGPPDEMSRWTYIRSYDVGLGEYDGTPIGRFVVRDDSKLINPRWVNPRTGEVFEADDPMNPIGEHWLGLRGLGEAADVVGYGIHGTIDLGSIGQEASMGCVRLMPDDVALVYELLEEGVSVVEIRE